MTDNARDQARSQLAGVKEMLRAADTDDDHVREDALQAIYDDPLEVSVRSDWQTPFDTLTPTEYRILLCTGGPAVQIIGDLNDMQPTSATMQYQDWGTPWINLATTQQDEVALIEYAQHFFP